MSCYICGEKVSILPNPNKDDYILTNKGILHFKCYIQNRDEDIYPLTKLGKLFVKDKIKQDKEIIKL
jgi:hypothetical protein